LRFIDSCKENNIPYKIVSIRLIFSDEMIESLADVEWNIETKRLQQKTKEKPLGICFSTKYFDISLEFSIFYLLHELGHCWLDLEYEDKKTPEFFADLLAMCILDKILLDKEIYRDTIIKSYIGLENGPLNGKMWFGKENQNKILDDPRDCLNKVFIKPNYVSFRDYKLEHMKIYDKITERL
jgi:hypothetical protein